jgi:hypothetical protein
VIPLQISNMRSGLSQRRRMWCGSRRAFVEPQRRHANPSRVNTVLLHSAHSEVERTRSSSFLANPGHSLSNTCCCPADKRLLNSDLPRARRPSCSRSAAFVNAIASDMFRVETPRRFKMWMTECGVSPTRLAIDSADSPVTYASMSELVISLSNRRLAPTHFLHFPVLACLVISDPQDEQVGCDLLGSATGLVRRSSLEHSLHITPQQSAPHTLHGFGFLPTAHSVVHVAVVAQHLLQRHGLLGGRVDAVAEDARHVKQYKHRARLTQDVLPIPPSPEGDSPLGRF